jgi:hypothetical protein
VDTEGNGQPNAGLTGDDTSGGDDEDGVTFPSTLVPGTTGTVQLRTGAAGGTVSCWIDFNRNGSWADAGEQVVADVAIAANTLTSRTFPVPVGSPQGPAATRCRISSQTGLGVTGQAADGEVEDHPAPVGTEQPRIGVSKRFVSAVRDNGNPQVFTVTFEIGVANLGNVPLSSVQVADNLATTFPAPVTFSVISVQSATLAVNNGFNGVGNTDLLAPGNTLAVGASGTVTLTLRVDSAGKRGPYTNQATATGVSPGNQTVTDNSQDGNDPDPDDDGDATDNDVPTVFVLPISMLEIPTLGTWGLLLLAGLLGAFAVRRLRRTA